MKNVKKYDRQKDKTTIKRKISHLADLSELNTTLDKMQKFEDPSDEQNSLFLSNNDDKVTFDAEIDILLNGLDEIDTSHRVVRQAKPDRY